MKPLIVANWKMNPTNQKEAGRLFNSLKRGLKNVSKAEVVICPPFVYLGGLKIKDLSFKLGAQNCSWQEKGAFTGEISPHMLKDLGMKYVIVGHSERRKIFQESDQMAAEKLKAVLKLNLIPILCIGETGEQRKEGETFKVLEKEIKNGLKGILKSQIGKVVVAYEPIWAIGTKNPCSSDDALTVTLFIRKVISQIFGKKAGKNIKILYGGSANSQNSRDYLKEEGINGLLVGGASLNPKEFLKIIKQI